MATFANTAVSDADALRLRGILDQPWRPTQFRTEAPDEMVDALCWVIAELRGEHDVETRDEHFEELHPRGPGGKFRTIAERIIHALEQHHAGKGDGDPLKEFNREQVRKVAKARGIDLPRGASEAHIKKALIDHAAPGGKTPGKVKAPAAATKKPAAGLGSPAEVVKTKAVSADTIGVFTGDYARRQKALTSHKGEPTVTPLEGGISSKVELLTYPDGSRVVRKDYGTGQFSHLPPDSEELSALVLDAFGLPAPAVARQDSHTILMEYVDGRQGGETGVLKAPAAVKASPAGRLLGLADAVMGHRDRAGGNWMQVKDGIVPIDNGNAFSGVGADTSAHGNPFTSYLMTGERWKTNVDVDQAKIETVRTRLARLRPEFQRVGHLRQFKDMMARLDEIDKRAHRGAIVRDEPHTPGTPKKPDVTHHRIEGKDQVDSVAEEIRNNSGAASVRNEDNYDSPFDLHLQHIAHQQGFDALPQVGSSADVDKAVAVGWVEVWRGSEGDAAGINDRLRHGVFEPGNGTYGSGVYTSTRRVTAERYIILNRSVMLIQRAEDAV